MAVERVVQFKTVRNCTDADLENYVNAGWHEHTVQFMPDGALHVVFMRRVAPEPVKPVVVIPAPASEDVEPPKAEPKPEEAPVMAAGQPTRMQQWLANELYEANARYARRVEASLEMIRRIQAPWERASATM